MAILINMALSFAGGSLIVSGQPIAGVAISISGLLLHLALVRVVSKT